MRTKQTVNICRLDKFIEKRDKRTYSLDQALAKIEEHIKTEIDTTFDTEAFREWYDGDSESPFYFNGIKYIWDCNTKEVS
jgi:hypothetical protein